MSTAGIVLLRVALAVLLAFELMVGLWNQFWPEHFYDNFPTVALTPPFSEHYARDFGGATLGIAVVLLAALIRPGTLLAPVAGLAYSVFAVPHFVFHLGHLHGATQLEAAALTTANGLAAALGILVIVLGTFAARGLPRAVQPTQTAAS